MRYSMMGMYDNGHTHGPITAIGPNATAAMSAFNKRQVRRSKVGTWRKGEAAWKHNDGSYIDPDWRIV